MWNGPCCPGERAPLTGGLCPEEAVCHLLPQQLPVPILPQTLSIATDSPEVLFLVLALHAAVCSPCSAQNGGLGSLPKTTQGLQDCREGGGTVLTIAQDSVLVSSDILRDVLSSLQTLYF